MALKYPNKKKRKGYWKRYRRADIKNHRKIWAFLDSLVEEIGIPFKKNKRGRPPKLEMRVLAKILIYMIYFDLDLREAESELSRFEKQTLNYSNIDRWFWRLDENWIRKATQALHEKIEKMFSRGEYISDSTGITTDRYYETTALDSKGNRILALLCLKLHVFVVYFFTVGLVSIANFHVTHGDANDNPIMHEYLLENVKIKKGRRHHADKGYWSKNNILKNKKLGLLPNIVPKRKNEKGLTLKNAIKTYDNDARKKYRGLVEGIFGGLTTNQGAKTRFRKDCARKTHIACLALTHEIRTYHRAKAHKALVYLIRFMQQPRHHHKLFKYLQVFRW